MNRNKYKCGEKKVKYALRKLSQGVFSVAIGSALFYSGPIMNNVHADAISNADKVIQGLQNKDSNFAKVELIPILKSELNNNEKSKITKNLPKITVNKNQKYYLVYQKNSQNILPKTNEVKSSINYLFIGSSIVLASWILLSKKARKSKFLFSVLLLNSFSGVQVLGLTMSNDQLLNRYKQTVEVPVGSSLPNIDVNIPGYEFLGYAPVENYSGKNDILKSNIGNKKPEENIKEVKSSIATKKDETVTEVIPYTTKTVDNPELEEGITKVKTAGENGIRSIVYKVTYDATGKEINRVEVSNTVTKAPVEEVIERGTKPKVTTTEKDETVTEVIPYTTKTIDNPELEEGITKVKTAGENGIRSIVYKVTYDATGKEINRVEVSNTVTKAPVEEVIERGTKKVKIDKNKLEIVIDQAKTYQENQYTTASWDVLRKALSSAEQTFNDTNSTQEQVDQAVSTLQASIKQLEKKPVNKEQLKQLIDQTKTYQENQYTTASWDVLRKALSSAEQTFNDTNSTQEQVDQAVSTLQASIKQLEKKQIEPKVILKNVIPDIVQKSASIDYKIVDPDSTIQSVQVNVYQGDKFVEQKELSLINYTVIINNLAYNTPYTLETIYRFSLNGQTISKTQNETQIIELLPKKLEINNYASTKLYKLNTNGELQNIIGLSDIPQDYSNYIVKVDTLNNKDILLPVHQIQEVTQDGIAKYKVIVHYPELVTYDPKTNDYIENYSFYINKIIKKENEYTTFNELVNAINKNPSGTFVVGSDLSASNSSVTGDSYISVDFTGTLKSEYGHTYNIYNLSKPLFNSIMNSTIKDINLLDVSISGSQSNVGALAKTAINSVIDNVHVSGKISAPTNIGGVVYSLTKNSTMLNSSFTGSINLTSSQNYFVGGLVGNLSGQSIINRSYADINIVATAYRNDNKIGGLVGQSDSNTLIENSYVTGKIKNSGTGGFVGGIIGSAWWNGRLQNIITSVKVTGGNIIHGDTGYTNAPFTNIYYVEGNASGNTNHQSTGITTNKAKELINNWNIKIIPIEPNYNLINYSYLLGYEKDREVSYHNIEKLIPLYDRYTILRYGNLVNKNDKLYTTKILSVTPMQNNFIITDIFSNLNKINRLLIHYEDGTVEFMKLSNSSTFKNTNLVEFQLGDNLIYTPMQFKSDFSNVLTNVLRKFQDIEYLSPDMLNKFGFMWTQNEIQAAQNKAIQDYKNNTKNPPINPEKEQELKQKALQDLQTSKYNKLRDMYLLESFTEVKKNISKELKSILTNGSVVDLNSLGIVKYLTDKLQNQALNLLLGLSYVNRLYNINYGDINIKDLAMYRTDFYGIKSNNLDWLISFGNIGYENLRVKNNYNSFSAQFSSITGKADLIDYLDYNRNLFLPNVDENNWFKSATKAYIYEASSKEVPNADVKIYSRLKGKYRAEYKNFILPLLNLKSNDVFVVTNMSTITFGLYERYIDEALKKTPTIYAQKVKEFEKTINHYGDLWAGYYDTWYRIVDDKVKSKLYTSDIPVWDGYWIIDNTQSGYWKNRWVGPYDSSVPGMTEFFGAIGKWYNPNGTGAYANGSLVHFVVDAVVSDYGTSTLTHEMTHNFDGKIYLNGYGRRNGQYAENFAMGLLQSPYTKDSSIYGLNLVYNWPEDSLRSQNYSPSIFKSDLDLGNYMHGVFDVTYLLDYVEAEVSLAKEKNDQKLLYKKLTSSGGTDKVVDFTDEEWNRMNLRTVNDLIDYNVVSSRYYKGANVGNNSYFEVSMYAPIYAGLQSTTGVSGGLIFRKSAYELLAAKGWDNGFVSYTSNQYADDAKNEGQVFSDSYVVHKILGNEYNDYAAFKKAMFQERIAKKDKLREITINWDNSNRTIRSYEDLKSLFEDALNKDLALAKSNRNMHYIDDLKSKIMQSCHLLTNDFKSSIFK
ncbi:ZmpA/ZmpB/ZmpC family metallo-endopeptidase [Enterococcus hirae]|uniref:ZmpA/ZmpB/ZmpC family metallo-endopeptidase n=1 Tax=Enterococcus hirae TaxID=1354 RepID=UPI0015F27852|nr:ZmpA/ZmpB/ZmpC family metallo-endopeptidase [Enterococcus hirae]MBA5252606.1 G5 domain-containing protein [Enterococcus hirae]